MYTIRKFIPVRIHISIIDGGQSIAAFQDFGNRPAVVADPAALLGKLVVDYPERRVVAHPGPADDHVYIFGNGMVSIKVVAKEKRYFFSGFRKIYKYFNPKLLTILLQKHFNLFSDSIFVWSLVAFFHNPEGGHFKVSGDFAIHLLFENPECFGTLFVFPYF